MLEGKAVIVETDMMQNMQQNAVDVASKALDFSTLLKLLRLAASLRRILILHMDLDGSVLWEQISVRLLHTVTVVSSIFCIGIVAVLLFKGSAGPDSSQANHCSSLEAVKS